MADSKKTDSDTKHAIEIALIVFFIYLIWLVFERIQQYMLVSNIGSFSEVWSAFVRYFVAHILPVVKVMEAVVITFCIYGIFHNIINLNKIVSEEKLIYGLKDGITSLGTEEPLVNERWEKVQRYINSINASDWKLAIIEADMMLDDLLRASGYHGESVGEMLKSVEKSDFLTLDLAWDAHKVRNEIAHNPGFDLNDREAKRVVALFESVFKEFEII